jgi:hypothetical protein
MGTHSNYHEGATVGRIQKGGKNYLTVDETCEILKCGPSRVRQLILDERLIAAKLEGVRARVLTMESVVDYQSAKRMLNGMHVDDIALSLVRIEKRLRQLEYKLDRRTGEISIGHGAVEHVSMASKLLAEIESLKHH